MSDPAKDENQGQSGTSVGQYPGATQQPGGAVGTGPAPIQGTDGDGGPEQAAEEGAAEEESKVVDLETAKTDGDEEVQAQNELEEAPGLFELGEPEMVKPIYALGRPGQPFIEKIQGVAIAGGVLVRWNNTATFFPGAKLDEGRDGAYILRT